MSKGIIEGTSVSVDATHTAANTFKATAERVMKYFAKKIFISLEKENGEIPVGINQEIPDYKSIKDHKEAKETMMNYLEETITDVKNTTDIDNLPRTKKWIENAQEVLADPKFIQQKGMRSLVDQDARGGRKSKNDSFFGYKTEFMMTTDERIITAVRVHDGAYVDGAQFKKLLEITQESGMTIEEVYGDKAYFRKDILDEITGIKAKPYIPVSAMAYKINEDLFSYNKDSDEWFCAQGNKKDISY